MPPARLTAATASSVASLRRSALSISASSVRPSIIGARVDTSVRYTDTGGSGSDSSALSSSPAAREARVHALYRRALRAIPAARLDFNLVEEAAFLRAMVRDLFVARARVGDGKVVDMLVFKGVQEVQEVELQFKSRTYLRNAVDAFHGKVAREAAVAVSGRGEDDGREAMLAGWKARGLVPAEIVSWGQYERWKAEENSAFAQFAEDAGLFDRKALERSEKMKSQCSVM